MWSAADTILEASEEPNTKFFALLILEQAIQVSESLYQFINLNSQNGRYFPKIKEML